MQNNTPPLLFETCISFGNKVSPFLIKTPWNASISQNVAVKNLMHHHLCHHSFVNGIIMNTFTLVTPSNVLRFNSPLLTVNEDV